MLCGRTIEDEEEEDVLKSEEAKAWTEKRRPGFDVTFTFRVLGWG